MRRINSPRGVRTRGLSEDHQLVSTEFPPVDAVSFPPSLVLDNTVARRPWYLVSRIRRIPFVKDLRAIWGRGRGLIYTLFFAKSGNSALRCYPKKRQNRRRLRFSVKSPRSIPPWSIMGRNPVLPPKFHFLVRFRFHRAPKSKFLDDASRMSRR